MGLQAKVQNFMKGGTIMTNMRRVTVSLPKDMDKRILDLKKEDRFARCSYAEVVRQIVEHGLDEVKANEKGA